MKESGYMDFDDNRQSQKTNLLNPNDNYVDSKSYSKTPSLET